MPSLVHPVSVLIVRPRVAVVGLVLVEDVAQRVEMAVRVAVIRHAIGVGGKPLVHRVLEGAGVVDLLGRERRVRQADGPADADERRGLLALGIGDEIGGAEFVGGTPAAPVRDFLEVGVELLAGRRPACGRWPGREDAGCWRGRGDGRLRHRRGLGRRLLGAGQRIQAKDDESEQSHAGDESGTHRRDSLAALEVAPAARVAETASPPNVTVTEAETSVAVESRHGLCRHLRPVARAAPLPAQPAGLPRGPRPPRPGRRVRAGPAARVPAERSGRHRGRAGDQRRVLRQGPRARARQAHAGRGPADQRRRLPPPPAPADAAGLPPGAHRRLHRGDGPHRRRRPRHVDRGRTARPGPRDEPADADHRRRHAVRRRGRQQQRHRAGAAGDHRRDGDVRPGDAALRRVADAPAAAADAPLPGRAAGARRADLRHRRRPPARRARTAATCSRCCCTRRTPKAAAG